MFFCFLIGKPATQNKLHHVWKLFVHVFVADAWYISHCLLFHRAEHQTSELSSACQDVFLINRLIYEDIYVWLYCLLVKFVLLCQMFFPCRKSSVISRQGRTTDFNPVYTCLVCIKIWAIFREASTKSLFPSFATLFSRRKMPSMTFSRCLKECLWLILMSRVQWLQMLF